ncbi:MAG: FHA domain-containing protein [Planctomycetaceae bacterium]|jgi:pSer/pThr/pTyr-binding forkhead associated (FHA) protein|nr:FHA domain-containing protein [Planctomycetaceae bacterium]MBT6483619.1 FHA domain-containing protein [Planctomycetaceae bacterium]MBT6495767.1 FHA domain-containing protein [Planctomycetaceae bacterium]
MLKAELKVTGGTHSGKSIPLAKKRFLIGRGEDCQLRPASEQISRHHCVFSIDDFTVRLRDLGSTNSTYVNDSQLHGEVILKDGDKIRVGALSFEIRILGGQVNYDSDSELDAAQSTLPHDVAPETTEMATTDTVLDLSDSPVETQSSGEAVASDTTVVAPQEQPAVAETEQATAQPAPPSPATVDQQGQPFPPQQMPPGGMPYPPQQAGYPYPPQPGMGYPQQPYPYPGYMPAPGQFPQQPMQYPPQQMQYPPAGQYPPAEVAAPESAPAAEATEIPVKLPDPESTGATTPEKKPVAPTEEGGGAPESNPSTMAAEAIKNMKNRLPGG